MRVCTSFDICLGVAAMAIVLCPAVSQAATVKVDFAGPGVSAALTLSVMPDTNVGTLPSTKPNSVDPRGSYMITGASGTFSDSVLKISDMQVSDVLGLSRATPEKGNDLAPDSFSFFAVTDGVDEGNGVISKGIHYDNLYYPGGSPQVASDYPFSGGYFDIYGLAFKLANNDVVNLWSNGVTPKAGLTYGVIVTDGTSVLDAPGITSLSAVPLPATAPMFAVALAALGVAGFGLKRRAKITG